MGGETSTMRACQRDYDGAIEYSETVTKPTVGSGKVLVRVRAAGLNVNDFKAPYVLAWTPVGVDFSGVVEEVGKGVTDFKVGNEVFGSSFGTLADYVLCAPTNMAHKPAHLTFQQAASMPNSYIAARRGLAGVKQGDKVLVIGASGGTGLAALQIATAMGAAEITAVCSSKNAQVVLRNGAHRVIDYETQVLSGAYKSWSEKSALNPNVLDAKQCEQVYFDYVLDAVSNSRPGVDYVADARKVLKSEGNYVLLNGARNTLLSSVGVNWVESTVEKTTLVGPGVMGISDAGVELNTLCAMKTIAPNVYTLPFTLDGVRQAFAILMTRHAVGKIVLDVSCDPSDVPAPNTSKAPHASTLLPDSRAADSYKADAKAESQISLSLPDIELQSN